ncbi:Nodulation protein E [Burkholderia sp. 8Y]|uniref:beta-ketoacyl-[acyl-carrier-protein] synthase family protein n=1 Tax=Burkholderia sp. 8Y TaxID=2653133 RepID=UPI0012F1B5C3|nr:beta-ketoacyl-[acyl-carrier-protein] synthase family protein [Burkholderia sp. 8Y]VXC67312.1 Nodulation protein E [Burkholderia sp. 8Y]
MRRVAVTGVGAICPLGSNAQQAYDSAAAGHSGIQRLDEALANRLVSPIGGIASLFSADHFEPAKSRMLDRVSQFALVASREAMSRAALEATQIDHARTGVFIGTGMGGAHTMDEGYAALYGERSERVKPFMVLMGMYNAPAAWISLEYGLRGPSLTYSSACSSSTVAIGEAWLRVSRGELDVALAGGSEAPLSYGSLKAWEALHTLAAVDERDPAASCKPFSKDRSGMVLAEGAAVMVLEEWEHAIARNAPIYGEVLGYGIATDIGHITRPSVEGQAAAMTAALAAAQLDPSEIDAINAHGTGTPANDATETAAVKSVFGTRAYDIPMSSTKSVHGHLLGASGALECLLCLMGMQNQTLLPTMHLSTPDPTCDLDYVTNAARKSASVLTMLSNSFAFGGTNAVLVLRSGEKSSKT